VGVQEAAALGSLVSPSLVDAAGLRLLARQHEGGGLGPTAGGSRP
jgi:hypothetical protein